MSMREASAWTAGFRTFGVPPICRRRVHLRGIVGAMIMRAVFILAGAALIARFHWLMHIFRVFLIYTGGKILPGDDVETHPESYPGPKLFGHFFPAERRPIGAGTPS
jgi:tellurite resistance protein TerC